MNAFNAVIALVSQLESQSGEKMAEKPPTPYLQFRQCCTVIFTILGIIQVVMTSIFIWRSRKVKEINWLPKIIMLFACIDSVIRASFFDASLLFNVELSAELKFVRNLAQIITLPLNMGQLIRFQRV